MILVPQRGDPPEEGRYVAFVRCESYQVKGWLEPEIATWHGGRWHNFRPVFAWIGPLPLCKWADYKDGLTWDEVFSDLRKTEHGSFIADRPAKRPCSAHCNNPKCDETRCFGKLEFDL